MKNEQLEAWVLSILDQVAAGRVVEDSRVELKADWKAPKTAARRIAGHANAAGSDQILWIVGVDEKKGVVPVGPSDVATWLPQVVAEFEGLAPSLQELVVPTPLDPVVALLFDASRRPFVVKNAAFGQTGGGPVSLEVPWRRGTTVQSARRDELLRILIPRQPLPDIELLEAGGASGGELLPQPLRNPSDHGSPCQRFRWRGGLHGSGFGECPGLSFRGCPDDSSRRRPRGVVGIVACRNRFEYRHRP
jgi:hypothetical protein